MGADLGRVINGSQHTPKDGGALGVMLVPVMKKQLDKLGIEPRTSTKAEDLYVKDGRVAGVRVSHDNGKYVIHAKGVILATGGLLQILNLSLNTRRCGQVTRQLPAAAPQAMH